MKKTLIAGAAATVAMAAMPMAGVFAVDFTDQIIVRINDTCALTRDTANNGHTDGSGTGAGVWGAVEGIAETGNDTLFGVVANGVQVQNFGSSKFHVECNNLGGWRVTANPSSLSAATSGNPAISNGVITGSDSAWSYTPSKGEDTDNTFTVGSVNAATVAKQTVATTTAGKDFTIQYGVRISETQPADTYTGTIEYTFAKGAE